MREKVLLCFLKYKHYIFVFEYFTVQCSIPPSSGVVDPPRPWRAMQRRYLQMLQHWSLELSCLVNRKEMLETIEEE